MAKLSTLMLIILTSCTYTPISDSRGNQGEKIAFRYNDDLQTCRDIASENTFVWIPDKLEYEYKRLINTCMRNRGHSILSKE